MAIRSLEEVEELLRKESSVTSAAYTAKDVARKLNCNIATIYRYVKQGKLKVAFKVGKQYRFTRIEIDEYVQNQRPGQEHPKIYGGGGVSPPPKSQ